MSSCQFQRQEVQRQEVQRQVMLQGLWVLSVFPCYDALARLSDNQMVENTVLIKNRRNVNRCAETDHRVS